MSTSPEVAQALPEFALRPITTARTVIQTTEDHGRTMSGGVNVDEECRTPTSEGSKLPCVPRCCPPAPRKRPRRTLPCKRRLWTSELDLITVGAKELEQLFQARGRGESAAPSRLAKKRRIQTAIS